MVENIGEDRQVDYCISHGMTDGVFAGDDAGGVERHALERDAVAWAMRQGQLMGVSPPPPAPAGPQCGG